MEDTPRPAVEPIATSRECRVLRSFTGAGWAECYQRDQPIRAAGRS
jgi:hypothetical protein